MLMRRNRYLRPALRRSGSGCVLPLRRSGGRRIMAPPEPDHHHLVGFGVEGLARSKHDERTVEPGDQLKKVVPVRVVHECSCPRRRKPSDEGLPWLDPWRHLLAHAAPDGHAIVVAVELYAMPVNGGWLPQLIDDGDLDRLMLSNPGRQRLTEA